MDHAYGYNLVDLGPYRTAIDALPAGERALVWIGNYSAASCAFDISDASVRQALGGLAGDPKVAGYYLADEADDALPAYGGHCPHVATQVTQRSRLIHQLAPGAFTYEVVTEPGNFAAFARATDVMGADPYPCLRGRPCDWAQIPAYIAALNAAHVPRYWALLQAFSYGKWRAPTAAELARMIGQWEQSRWQGEQTFSWSYLGWSLASHPDLLAVLKSLNAGNIATVTGTQPDASVKVPSGTADPQARISALVQVCTLTAEDACDPENAADWASSATVYSTKIRWRVVITNTGTGPVTGLYVTSSLAPKENDCAGSVPAGPLKAGAVTAYECETDHVAAPVTITQTITASGDPPAGPVLSPASSAATARVASSAPPQVAAISARLQICILPNQASCDPTRAADWASSGPLSAGRPVAGGDHQHQHGGAQPHLRDGHTRPDRLRRFRDRQPGRARRDRIRVPYGQRDPDDHEQGDRHRRSAVRGAGHLPGFEFDRRRQRFRVGPGVGDARPGHRPPGGSCIWRRRPASDDGSLRGSVTDKHVHR